MSIKNPTNSPRTRTRSNLATLSYSAYARRTLNGVVTTTDPSVVLLSSGDIMTDTVTPGFAQRSARGELIQSPMNKSHTEYSGGDGGWTMSSANNLDVNAFIGDVTPVFHGFPTGSAMTIDVENLKTLVQTQCLSSVKTSSLMGFVTAAESAKTIRMLANPLGTLRTLVAYVSQLRKGRKNLHIDVVNGDLRRINGKLFRVRNSHRGPGKPIRVPKSSIVVPFGDAISGSVLAFNLGLQPLLSDIEAIFNEIPKAHQLARQTFRANASDEQVIVDTTPIAESVFLHQRTKTTTHKVKVRTCIVAGDIFDIAQDFGMSVHDIPEAALELIPYSFLVDYVFNLGDYLGAARAQRTQNVLASATTVTIESVADTVCTGTTSTSTGWKVVSPLVGSYKWTSITKTRTLALDHIGLAIRPVAKIVTPRHVQNVLSLTVQQLIGMKTGKPRTFY